MAIRPIRLLGDPILREKCQEITTIDESIERLVEDLIEGVQLEGRAGLAANQIGIGLQAFSWNIEGEVGYILNPRLVEVSEDEFQTGDEGCLSIPQMWYKTKRYNYAKVEGINLKGKRITVDGSGLMARCLQHETDHLQGKLYIDRLEGKEKTKAMEEIAKQKFY